MHDTGHAVVRPGCARCGKIHLDLRHGRIVHGFQFLSPEKRRLPTSYYTEDSGIGVALRVLRTAAFTLCVARGPEHTRLAFGSGWMF